MDAAGTGDDLADVDGFVPTVAEHVEARQNTSSRRTTAISPTPRLKTRAISSSSISPRRWISRKIRGTSQLPRSTTASQPVGSTRLRLPGMPPPVMCAIACTPTARQSALHAGV